jgi:myosin heavy subunit
MSQSSSSRGSVSVENQILDSNPILESFGNAKTIRNNNSSRFGKYMEINFDKKNCIKGCNITSYLLEKTRVVKVTQLERNYHIFYMLVAGASTEQRKEFYLRNAEQFVYLIQGECITINRRDDAEEFRELVKAMNNLGFDERFRHDLYQTLAGILHLGNLEFSPKSDEGSVIASSNDCKVIAKLLGLADADLLEKTLCYRENIVSKETFMIPLNPARAKDQRDALAKFIYGRIFDVVVTNVNSSLFRGKLANNIGILGKIRALPITMTLI